MGYDVNEYEITPYEDIKKKYDKWKAARKDAEEWIQHFRYIEKIKIAPTTEYCSIYSHQHNTGVITIKEHIDPGDWITLNQNGEAVKGNTLNKLKK